MCLHIAAPGPEATGMDIMITSTRTPRTMARAARFRTVTPRLAGSVQKKLYVFRVSEHCPFKFGPCQGLQPQACG